jgi:prophage regulatory protein
MNLPGIYSKQERFLRLPEVLTITGLSRSTLYLMVGERRFPAPCKLGLRAVGWSEGDIEAWLVGVRAQPTLKSQAVIVTSTTVAEYPDCGADLANRHKE